METPRQRARRVIVSVWGFSNVMTLEDFLFIETLVKEGETILGAFVRIAELDWDYMAHGGPWSDENTEFFQNIRID